MSRFIRTALMVGGLIGAVSIGTASAQIDTPIQFTTTFPFTVGNATVPAGRYIVRPADGEELLLELTGLQNKASVFFEITGTQATRPDTTTEVVFKKYGDHYVLKDIFLEGSQTGAETLAVRGEKHHAKGGMTPTEHHVKATKASTMTKAGKS